MIASTRNRLMLFLGAMLLLAGLPVSTAGGDLRLASLVPLPETPPHGSMPPDELSKGVFLVAGKEMRDFRFRESVILVTEYGVNGSVGFIINRPTGIMLSEALPEVEALKGNPGRLYLGGPVEVGQVFMLIRSEKPPAGSRHVFEDVYVSASLRLLEVLMEEKKSEVRLYAGYAGWAPLQLEREVALGVWRVLPADRESVFSEDPDGLWEGLFPAPPDVRTDLRPPALLPHELPVDRREHVLLGEGPGGLPQE